MMKDGVTVHSTMPPREYRQPKAVKLTRERLAPIVEGVPEDERGAAEALRDEITFMAGTLATLKQFIADNGAVTLDDRTGTVKESPAVRSYNAMVPRFSAAIKQLCKMSEAAPKSDPLMELLESADDEDEDEA